MLTSSMQWRHWARQIHAAPVTSQTPPRTQRRVRSRGPEMTSSWRRRCATWNRRWSDIYRRRWAAAAQATTSSSPALDIAAVLPPTGLRTTWPAWRHRRYFRPPTCCERCTTPQCAVNSEASSVAQHPAIDILSSKAVVTTTIRLDRRSTAIHLQFDSATTSRLALRPYGRTCVWSCYSAA